nr:MAG TPA: hypothetical protein [Caudoviricetes sp.]
MYFLRQKRCYLVVLGVTLSVTLFDYFIKQKNHRQAVAFCESVCIRAKDRIFTLLLYL